MGVEIADVVSARQRVLPSCRPVAGWQLEHQQLLVRRRRLEVRQSARVEKWVARGGGRVKHLRRTQESSNILYIKFCFIPKYRTNFKSN